MRREWTDPRDGREWTVTRVGGVGTPNTGERAEPTDDPLALVFTSGDDRYALPTDRAGELESIGEEELGELLDAAREAA